LAHPMNPHLPAPCPSTGLDERPPQSGSPLNPPASVTQRALSVAQRAVSVTQRALSVNQRALSVTQRALSVTSGSMRSTTEVSSRRSSTPEPERSSSANSSSHRLRTSTTEVCHHQPLSWPCLVTIYLHPRIPACTAPSPTESCVRSVSRSSPTAQCVQLADWCNRSWRPGTCVPGLAACGWVNESPPRMYHRLDVG
jgi:hypothetical protein